MKSPAFPKACRDWILTQFGTLLQHPKALAAIPLPANFPEITESLGRSIDKKPMSLTDVEAAAKTHKVNIDVIMTLLSSLSSSRAGGSKPLIELVIRDRAGNRFNGALSDVIGTPKAKRLFVFWQKTA